MTQKVSVVIDSGGGTTCKPIFKEIVQNMACDTQMFVLDKEIVKVAQRNEPVRQLTLNLSHADETESSKTKTRLKISIPENRIKTHADYILNFQL